MPRLPPIVTFAAPSGTGKTTLLEGIVAALVRRGLRVGVVKHDAHRLVLDTPGKDSWRLRQAGAYRCVVASRDDLGIFGTPDGESSLVGLVQAHLMDADVVLTEGFRRAGLPAIRVRRAGAREDATWQPPPQVIAWVSDTPVDTDLPVFALDDPEATAAFLVTTFLPATPPQVRCTTVFPVATPADVAALSPLVARLQDAGAVHLLAVTPPGGPGLPGIPQVIDLRPGDGPLGALLTGLAAANTPDVLFVGPRHAQAPQALLDGLRTEAHHSRVDLTTPVTARGPEPLCAVYGHGCLPAIHGALLSGERRMTGWWGQVAVRQVPAARWAAWDPGLLGFPGA